jgi:hypothetical protein
MTTRLDRVALALVLTLGVVATVAAQPRPAGTVTRLEGSAAVARSAAPQATPLRIKDSVYLRDLVTTGEQSRAQMLLGGKATVTMREQSSLRITEVPGVSSIDISDGRLKLALKKNSLKPGERIEVKTPNAITAVRGTVVVVEVLRTAAGVRSRFTLLDGLVEVSSIDPASGQPRGTPVTLRPLQQVDVAGAGAPGTPQAIGRADADRLDATFAFALKPGGAAGADLLKKQMEQAASDAAALQGAGGSLTPPGSQGTTPSVSGDSLRLRGGTIGPPPTGGGRSTSGN